MTIDEMLRDAEQTNETETRTPGPSAGTFTLSKEAEAELDAALAAIMDELKKGKDNA